MAKHYEVLAFLRPNGGYVQIGEDYEGITFEPHCEPFTKEEYEAAFVQYDAWKLEQDTAKAIEKQSLLSKLGITEEEVRLLLS